jgi:HAD superfamily hydrolase (TIGR01509 family)
MIKAVVFDLNGVFLISDYLTDRIEKEFSIPVEESLSVLKKSLEEVRINPNIKIFKFWVNLFRKHDIKITEEEFLTFWFKGETLIPEFLEITKQLKNKGIKVYVFSNNFKERTEYYRRNFEEIFENIDNAFFSWETGYVKPSLEAFQNLLKEINNNPSEIIYIDDSQENVDVAASLGIRSYIYGGIEETKNIFNKEGVFI